MGIGHVVMVVGLVATSVARAAEPPDVTPEQLQRIEALSCRAWHGRAIARHRIVEEQELDRAGAQDGKVHVALSCDPYDSSGGWSVRDDGHCKGSGTDWTCDEPWPGVFRAHESGTYEAALSETSVKTGVQILEHLIDKAHRGEDWAKYALDGYLHIAPFGDDPGLWHLEYEWTDADRDAWMSVIEVRGRCRKDGCHFRSKFLTTYSLLRL